MLFLDELMDRIRQLVLSLMKQNEPTFFYGVVTAVNPLKIKVKDSYEIDESFIILDSRCRHTVVQIPVDGANQHTHGMDEALVDYQATGNMGAPVIFVPLGVEAYVPNPDFDSSMRPTDDEMPGSGSNPAKIINPAIPNPTTLPLKHQHTIHSALPEMLLWRGLKVGDNVKILRLTGGSIHYVFERVERLDNPGELDSGKVKSQDDEENWA